MGSGSQVQEHWRPRSYPTQTCDPSMQVTRNMSLSTMVEEPFSGPLPNTIRAVQDSNMPYTGTRTIVICLDGTGDKFDGDNSNVVNFVACLKKDDPSQITYYQSGIGTYDGHGLKSGISAAIDKAVGSGLGVHIKDAYKFIMQNYTESSKIHLLGFSRGAYTARCLAGMLHKVGLLPAHNRAQVSFAYDFYKDDSESGWEMSAQFKKTFCIDVNVDFVGLWDCVSSVGFLPRKLPFGKSEIQGVGAFRHAMALDERRAKFKLCQWQHRDLGTAVNEKDDLASKAHRGKEKLKEEKDKEVGKTRRMFSSCFGLIPTSGMDEASSIGSNQQQEKLEAEFNQKDASVLDNVQTDVLEVWFAGCHADVGGGAVPNSSRHMLSRIPLRWMIRQCFVCNTGILFSTAALAETGIDVPTLYPVYKPPRKPVVGPSPCTVELKEEGRLPGLDRRSMVLGVDEGQQADVERGAVSDFELLPEHVEDHFDALAPINDQLVIAKGWWVLEFWPVKVRVQRNSQEGGWVKVVRFNMGRFRGVRETEPTMHWSVERRTTELKGKKAYKVLNVVDRNAQWRIGI